MLCSHSVLLCLLNNCLMACLAVYTCCIYAPPLPPSCMFYLLVYKEMGTFSTVMGGACKSCTGVTSERGNVVVFSIHRGVKKNKPDCVAQLQIVSCL